MLRCVPERLLCLSYLLAAPGWAPCAQWGFVCDGYIVLSFELADVFLVAAVTLCSAALIKIVFSRGHVLSR